MVLTLSSLSKMFTPLYVSRGRLVIFLAVISTSIWADHQRDGKISKEFIDAAIERTQHDVTYDGSYRSIPYPMGDVPETVGVCTDVVIRAYRKVGIDLQQLVHEDIRSHFDAYPNLWGLHRPDTNIDHRRVPNLQRFFARHGKKLPITSHAEDYKPGDIVTWMLPGNLPHIGIVSNRRVVNTNRYKIVHNIGLGPKLDDILFRYEITGHYRYLPHDRQQNGV